MIKLTPGVFILLMTVLIIMPSLQILAVAIFILKGFYHCYKAFPITLPCFKTAPMKFPAAATQKAKLYSQKSIKYSAVFPYIGREVMIFEDKERNLITNGESVWKLKAQDFNKFEYYERSYLISQHSPSPLKQTEKKCVCVDEFNVNWAWFKCDNSSSSSPLLIIHTISA